MIVTIYHTGRRENHNFPALREPRTGCVTWGESLNISQPQAHLFRATVFIPHNQWL